MREKVCLWLIMCARFLYKMIELRIVWLRCCHFKLSFPFLEKGCVRSTGGLAVGKAMD